MNIIQRFRKTRAIKSYVTKLPRLLVKDYGPSRRYTPQQVRRTIERSGLDIVYSCYGLAMFSTRDDFIQFHSETGESCDYDAMRIEIAHSQFADNADFTFADIASSLSEHGSDADHSGSHDTGGGDGHGGR